MEKLSAYILTKNSERYLDEIIQMIYAVVEEILIIDSYSTDNTENIVKKYDKTHFIVHPFQNFKDQRNFAAKMCSHHYVLFLDSDEIPDDEFVKSLQTLKEEGFTHDAYAVRRQWMVLGKYVRCIYPITSPDYPIRLFNKEMVGFNDSSNGVHETPEGWKSKGLIKGSILHKTFHSKKELYDKLAFYTQIAAQDLIVNKRTINYSKAIFSPIAAFVKWYFLKKGYKDGMIGFILGKYAYLYTRKKYAKAIKYIRENK